MSNKKDETICLEPEEGSWEIEIKRTYDHIKPKVPYRQWKRHEGFDEFCEKSIIKLYLIQKANNMDAFIIDYF